MAAVDVAVRELEATIGAACPGAPVVAELPDDVAAPAVVVLPLTATPAGRRRDDDSGLDLLVRVLVIPLGPDALSLLEQCMTALDAAPGCDLEADEQPLALWSALTSRPRPALVVRRRVRVPLPRQRAQLVTHALQVQTGAARLLDGRVVGPHGVAMPFATVSADGGRSARCDADGRFRLLVAGETPHRLTVSVKGRVLQGDVAATDLNPLVVRCERLEN